ncbi:MAG: MaoC family dehydratase N-terminal domain-containing protein [Gemmatimonadales bacterium]
MIDPKHVGKTWPPYEVEIDKSQLRLFAKAIDETRPEYVDEAAARRAGHPSLLAPPTFAIALAAADPNGLDYLHDVGIPIARLLHADQRFTYHAPMFAGHRVAVTRRVADVYAKKNGALEFVRFEMEFRDAESQDLLVESAMLLVVRHEATP